ncbi:AAA family ATPase [Nonlabens sp. MIC269]|uniref:AAA family ATPase n=1 Tax=Nonlabens sp. MIC269 TaxID=1476901 RepID=UPI0012F97AFC
MLLLNGADAVLCKRSTNPERSTDKMENAIQNIFLDCIETFEGILFATTNLEQSLDKAFERRLLFKIMFYQTRSTNKN